MIALKNTTDNQIFYIIHRKMDGESGWDLTSFNVEYTENGQYSIVPPNGYDGMSSVNVTVDVPQGACNLTTSTVTVAGDGEHTIIPPQGYDGFSEVIVNVETGNDRYEEGVADQKAKLTSVTFTENDTYTREDGWNAVTVNVDTVTPYNNGVVDGIFEQKAKLSSLNVTANGTYRREDGYNEVVVSVAGTGSYEDGRQAGLAEQKSKLIDLEVTENGTYEREDGYGRVDVAVDTVTPYNNGKSDGIEEQKDKLTTIVIESNGTYTREDGYDRIIVNVACGGTTLYASPTIINTDQDGGTYSINVYSDSSWNITGVPNWITLSQNSGEPGISAFTLTVDSYNDVRSGSFVITNGSNSITVFVYQRYDYGHNYLTFEAFEGGRQISWVASAQSEAGREIQYSLDDGQTWTTLAAEYKQNGSGYTTGFVIPYQGKVLVKGTMNSVWNNTNGAGCHFWDGGGSGNYYRVYGNIMSLLRGDNFYGSSFTTSNNYAFKQLFLTCCSLREAYDLVLPNNTRKYCYESMFESACSKFYGPPKLPATVMSEGCYKSMFEGCNLSGDIALPATTLASHCYERMFHSSHNPYVAILPATTLQPYCYKEMFYGCLRTTAPELPATVLVEGCYQNMFNSCTNLNSVKCLAVDTSATNCTQYWLANVSTSGTFVKNSSKSWTRGYSGVPENWIIQNA